METPRFVRANVGASLRAGAAAVSVLLFATRAGGQQTTRVSVDSSGAEANLGSDGSSVSSDGRVVVFVSNASNLVAGDSNNCYDVFVHDLTTGITERVSVDSSGAEGDAESNSPSISADGQIVAFESFAANLVAGDSNGFQDVFVHDRATGITERVSVDSSGAEGNSSSGDPSISADGQIVSFDSSASNLVSGDANNSGDVFVHDRSTGITERSSVSSSGVGGNGSSGLPSISADGNVVGFESGASNLVAGDKNHCWDVFVHDRATGITERMSVDSSGKAGDAGSQYASISADGQDVSFSSDATNLVAGDTNRFRDVFVHDRTTGLTERVSVDSSGAQGNFDSDFPSISAAGQFVAFVSRASNLVAGDTNGCRDVFVRDRTTGITDRVSVDSSGVEGNADSWNWLPSISADGNVVTFTSGASNLVAGDTNAAEDIFVHERCSIDGSWTNYGSGFPGTNGIPSLTSQQNPSFGATITLDLANSCGAPTSGFLVVGFQRGSFNMKYGAQLFVVPALIVPITFSYGADSFTGTIPDDVHLCGVVVDLQGIEADPGAAGGLSFSQGLELMIGN